MKAELVALRTIGFGLFLAVLGFGATLVKLAANVISMISNEIAMASVGRMEKLSF